METAAEILEDAKKLYSYNAKMIVGLRNGKVQPAAGITVEQAEQVFIEGAKEALAIMKHYGWREYAHRT